MEINFKIIFGVISILLIIPGQFYYMRSIIKGKTKPHLYTIIIFLILMSIGFLIQLDNGGGAGSWLNGFMVITQIITFILCIKYGYSDISKFDTIILMLALLTIPIYLYLDNSYYSLTAIIIIDVLAMIPTVKKVISHPFSEDLVAWNISITRSIFSILAISNFSILTALYPITISISSIFLVVLMLFLRRFG